MDRSTQELALELLKRVHTTETLKHLSDTLEELSQNKTFKQHLHIIVADKTLTGSQKKSQLLYLIRTVEVPLLYDFFSDTITASNFWLFESDTVDYFDKFVQSFQMATESVDVLFLTTSIALPPEQIKSITQDISKTFGKQVILKHEVNPALMGGAIARMGNTVFDMSLRARFSQFERHWIATLEKTSKQVGRFELEDA